MLFCDWATHSICVPSKTGLRDLVPSRIRGLMGTLWRRCRSWVSGGAGAPALGPGLSTTLLERAAAAGAPFPGQFISGHTLGPQGVTQPCSPHSSSAMQPVGPPSLRQGLYLGVVRNEHSEPPHCPLGPCPPQPALLLSAFVSERLSDFVSEHLSDFVSTTIICCFSLPCSGKVQFVSFCFSQSVALSPGSLSGTKSGDTSAPLSGS